jgi:hypothetical protein
MHHQVSNARYRASHMASSSAILLGGNPVWQSAYWFTWRSGRCRQNQTREWKTAISAKKKKEGTKILPIISASPHQMSAHTTELYMSCVGLLQANINCVTKCDRICHGANSLNPKIDYFGQFSDSYIFSETHWMWWAREGVNGFQNYEACAVSKVPQPVTFVLMKDFVFR